MRDAILCVWHPWHVNQYKMSLLPCRYRIKNSRLLSAKMVLRPGDGVGAELAVSCASAVGWPIIEGH